MNKGNFILGDLNMLKLQKTLPLTLLIVGASIALPAAAQEAQSSEAITVIRNTKAIPYWIEADRVRVRETPVSGDVVSLRSMGQVVKAYGQKDGWLKVSKPGRDAQWINAKYVSTSAINRSVNMASFTSSGVASRTKLGAYDVDFKLVDIDNNSKLRIYAAAVKKTDTNATMVVTQQDFRGGSHFETHLVSCSGGAPTHTETLGEGFTYEMMDYNIKEKGLDLSQYFPQIALDDAVVTKGEKGVAQFACAQSL